MKPLLVYDVALNSNSSLKKCIWSRSINNIAKTSAGISELLFVSK